MAETNDQAPVSPVADRPKPNLAPLAKAFAAAQGQFRKPTLNRTAKVTKDGKLLYEIPYADLGEIIDCIRGPLAENELFFTQTLQNRSNTWLLILTVWHSSGVFLESILPIKLDQPPQQIGGALTYFKRYQLSAFMGVAADYDDDGNAGQGTGNTVDGKSNSKGGSKGKSETNPAPQKNQSPPAQSKPQQQAPPPKTIDPQNYVMPFGNETKGKKLHEIPVERLRKALAWAQGELKKEKPRNPADLKVAVAQISLFLKAFEPPPSPPTGSEQGPPPDDSPLPTEAPEEPPMDDQSPFPEDEPQQLSTPENESQVRGAKPLKNEAPKYDVADFVIPQALLLQIDKEELTSIPLRQIPEHTIREVLKAVDIQTKKHPPVALFQQYWDTAIELRRFLTSMGVQP